MIIWDRIILGGVIIMRIRWCVLGVSFGVVLFGIFILGGWTTSNIEGEQSAEWWMLQEVAALDVEQSETANQATFPNCRLGASIWSPYQTSVEFDLFHFGTYINFSSEALPGIADLDFWPMVRLKQDRGTGGEYLDSYTVQPTWTTLEAVVRANPGKLWIVGNEPDREFVQDDTYPDVYARAYHDIYTFIKDVDPTARIAVAGLVGFTPGREQYLDIVWDTYATLYGSSMPADAWTIHPYVLWESGGGGGHVALGTDPTLAIPYSPICNDPASICYAEHDDMQLFIEQIVRMRQWMSRHGQRNKPLMVTEWGIILPEDFVDEEGANFSATRVSTYLRATQDYFRTAVDPLVGHQVDDNRLVQQWQWFAFGVDEVQSSSSRLVEVASPYYSTDVGKAWQQYAAAIPPVIDLRVRAADAVIFNPSTSVTLTATLYNVGNIGAQHPVTVAFYISSTAHIPFHTQTLDIVPGCMWGQSITATWSQTWSPGRHPYWVNVETYDDSSLVIATSAQGWIWVDPKQVFMPLVLRNR